MRTEAKDLTLSTITLKALSHSAAEADGYSSIFLPFTENGNICDFSETKGVWIDE